MKAKIPKIKPDTEINRMGKKEKATKESTKALIFFDKV